MVTGSILRRLQQDGLELPSAYDQETLTWNFDAKISRKDLVFFRRLLSCHLALNLEYSIHCTRLAYDFERKAKENEAELFEEIKAALIMAELLEHLNQYYLDVPREVARLRKEQDIFRKMLVHYGIQFPQKMAEEEPSTNSLTRTIRDQAAAYNYPRLMTVRSRRLLVALSPLFNEGSYYHQAFGSVDWLLGPTLSYLSWIYFAPRLMTNLFLLGKHALPGSWMSQSEKQLGWKTRVGAHFDRRWFEIGNDLVWFVGGLINCFVLVGAWAPIGPYFSVALQGYDVFLATVRSYVEVGRLHKLREEYLGILKNPAIRNEDKADILNHLYFLDNRIAYESSRFSIGILTNSALLLAMAAALPLFVFHPLVPVIAAMVILYTTELNFKRPRVLEQIRPSDKITDLNFTPDSPITPPGKIPQSFFHHRPQLHHSLSDGELHTRSAVAECC